MQYVLALDIGTSAVKAALVNVRGQQVAIGRHEYELETPSPGIVELEPEMYWSAVQSAISIVLASPDADVSEIGFLGVTSQGETLIVLDESGQPLRKAIVWLDNRAENEARGISEAFDVDEVYRQTGQQTIISGATAPRILWLRNHEPAVFRKAARFLLVEDYIIFRLTGRYVSDHAINSSTLYYDLTAHGWWQKMLDFLGISRSQLPELLYSGEHVGQVRADIGLSTNTGVTSTPMDQITGAVGAGNVAPGIVTETTGSALAVCASSARPVYDPHRRVGLYCHAKRDVYVLLPWVPTAGIILRWFRDELGGERSFAELTEEAQAVPVGCHGLTMLPHFGGALAPDVNPAARGVLYGLSLTHTRAHLVRAIMEAISFMLKDNLDMLESLGVATGTVCSLGGGAQNDLWLQIKANVLGRKVVTPDVREAACQGVAIIAAVAGGEYTNIEEAVKEMVKIERSFAPEKGAVEAYGRVYEEYRHLNEMLLPTFGGLTETP